MEFAELALTELIKKTADALTANNFLPIIINTKEEALAQIKELIPKGVSVQNGASQTLEQIGFVDYLKDGEHGWNNLHATILAEKDEAKQTQLRKEAVLSDYYLGSVHALSATGELVIASNTGSQLPHLAFTSANLILVVGAQKITPSLADALRRLEEYVVPLEDKRAMAAWGGHTIHAKTLILHKENANIGRKVHVIIVNEVLGF